MATLYKQEYTFAEVILPLALPQHYTYIVPLELQDLIQPGHRVIVQFGKNKYYSAIVAAIHQRKPSFEVKAIETLADEEPVVTALQLKFWQWMADYYGCTTGEVMVAALPSGLKISSETKILYNENYEGDFESFNDEEFIIIKALRAQQELYPDQIQQLLAKKNIYPLLRKLFDCGLAISAEEIQDHYQPKTETLLRLSEPADLENWFDQLKRAPRQAEMLLAFLQLAKQNKHVRKPDLIAACNGDSGLVSKLTERGIFIEFKSVVSRLGRLTDTSEPPAPLSPAQQQALREIREGFASKPTVLLHGITGSGKTRIYIDLIQQMLNEGKQVLYLLPEIALTAQIINRLRQVFGKEVGIYHSRFNQHERVEIWHKVMKGEYKIVVGARSAVFLPFHSLGLCIIDEEHDASLKQTDPAPRYHARDAALRMAAFCGAKSILGTATPQIESYYHALNGKYALVELNQRYADVPLPKMELIDLKPFRKQGTLQGLLSPVLTEQMGKALERKEQIILFHNRRGFARYQLCTTCNEVYQCPNCEVSLTYHKFSDMLVCHYCGYHEKRGIQCKQCGSNTLDIAGSGTERLEEDVQVVFPKARIARMDLDTVKGKHALSRLLTEFENREIDILAGTQMLSKGLDFDHVSLVGVVLADQLLFYPGFRAAERTFQILTQVAGRAGRKEKQGRALIQTFDPQHPVLQHVLQGDYRALYDAEIAIRRQFHYPPFVRMISLTLKHGDAALLDQAASELFQQLKQQLNGVLLGPSAPPVSKIRNQYLREILIKFYHVKDLPQQKTMLRQAIVLLKNQKDFKRVEVQINVDP